MKYKDYYKILGIKRDASVDEIKRAYRRLARKYHPDVSKEADAEARFKEINEAHEVLKDPKKRAAYDQLGSNWQAGQEFRPPPGSGGFNTRYSRGFSTDGAGGFSDFFDSLFGHDFGFSNGMGGNGLNSRNEEQTAKLSVSLEDAYSGASRTIQLESQEPDRLGGIVDRHRRLKVRIPAGVTQGQKIRLAGQGSARFDGSRGNLLLEVELKKHPLYRPEGKDIYIDLPVTPSEAVLGAKVSVPTLGGSVTLTIPAGSQNGRKLRLKGRGLPGKPPGEQYVILQIRVPDKPDQKTREAYRHLQQSVEFNPRKNIGN
ncbi:MAG: DnaJ C-terminal domain-containing protein [Candidatus Sedimenticola sp. 20ELBAFRAG]